MPDLMVGSAMWCFGGELDYGLCMDFVLHHCGRQNSPLIQIVMLRIMTRTVRYCNLVYSEFLSFISSCK